MKVIFLDIDGVMNCENHPVVSEVHVGLEFSPEAIQTLQEVIEETGAKIVISSTWRFGRGVKELQDIFKPYSQVISDAIVGKTGEAENRQRSTEIGWYIESSIGTDREVTDFVIIDDDIFDMNNLKPFLVRTNYQSGLTKEHKHLITIFLK